jgi:hypothetical protein
MVTQTQPPPFRSQPLSLFIHRILAKDGYREAATLAIRIMAVVFGESTTILNHLQPSLTLHHIHHQSVVSYIEEILKICL